MKIKCELDNRPAVDAPELPLGEYTGEWHGKTVSIAYKGRIYTCKTPISAPKKRVFCRLHNGRTSVEVEEI